MGDLRDTKDAFESGVFLNTRPSVGSSLSSRAASGSWTSLLPDIETGERKKSAEENPTPHSQREKFLYEQGLAQGRAQAAEQSCSARESEHAQSKQEGYAQGFEAGLSEGLSEGLGEGRAEVETLVEVKVQELQNREESVRLETIASSLTALKTNERTAARKRDMEMMSLMIEILGKILPSLASAQAEEEVRLFLKSVFERFEQIPSVVITLAPSGRESVSRLKDHLKALLSDEDIDHLLSFRFDSGLGDSDCRVSWSEGEAERNFQLLWQKIEEILRRHLPLNAESIDTQEPQTLGD